jgi:ribosomal protein S12 methylthiotransferase accessory factor
MDMPGPDDPRHVVPSRELLGAAHAAARAAGVTRLANVTRLDRIGLPVWQAVRPMSRALSVHQGKGATDADAQVGALLEAVESHHSEIFDREGPICRFDALPGHARAPVLDDFARDRQRPPPAEAEHRWVEAEGLGLAQSLFLPLELVSLDFTRNLPSPFDRSSNGVGTGTSRGQAIEVALQEQIERDAVNEWQSRGIFACTLDALRLDSVPFDWLGAWRDRIAAAGARFRLYRVPSITGTPVFACEINDPSKPGLAYGITHGQGCHPIPEIALFRALAEALQARATVIAGSRDDMGPDIYEERRDGVTVTFGLPLPPAMRGVEWDEIAPGPIGWEAIVETLASRGYGRIGVVELGRPSGFAIVRAFVCGLGSTSRRRRAPLQ